MSVKEMWKYLTFQTKGYRIIEAVIVLGAICGAATAYINSFLYARILNQLLAENYTRAIRMTIVMTALVFGAKIVSEGCNEVFGHYIAPSRDETKKRTAKKAFIMEFEEMEKAENLSAFRRVRAGENGAGEIDDQLRAIYEFFTECVKVFFALAFLAVLLVKTAFAGTGLGKAIVLTTILVVIFVTTLWLNFRITDYIGKRQVEMNLENEKGNSLTMYLFSAISNEQALPNVHLYRMQKYLTTKWNNSIVPLAKSFTAFGEFEGRQNAKFSLMVQVLAGYIYVYVAINALGGIISSGDVLMYAGAMVTMMSGVQGILLRYNQIRYCNEYLKTYEEFIKRPNMHYDGTLPIEKRDDNRYELSFSHVSFKYHGTEEYILKDISLKFHIGEKLALVGRNGAGKTTLIKLLLRLYEPTEGSIQLNGIDIGKYDYDEYLQIFSVVFQDFTLFDFPLDENIAGGETVDEERIQQVLEQMGLSERVEEMPQKEHTLLYHETGEGVALSGGEAQKVAIARALYKDAPFVILDEPTAALDPIAEAEVYENFDSLIGEKTAIYISHRMSSCKFCDRIIVLNQGEIAEEGSHDILLSQGGIYADLYQTQAAYYQ
ncbi:MAG: ABC transporter ATP-binding protein/permease [Acetatifactor sp.]|nr:ABC transporter ATP-binding protein/permease [Acetatifactor sp.]